VYALGELAERMSEETVGYAVAHSDTAQYRKLVPAGLMVPTNSSRPPSVGPTGLSRLSAWPSPLERTSGDNA
jgi:hypothetical protein